MTTTPKFQYDYIDGEWRDVWNNTPATKVNFNAYDSVAEAILFDRCQICGCVDSGPIMIAMYALLVGWWTCDHVHSAMPAPMGNYSTIFDDDNFTQLLIAILADQAGFIDHGGNIAGSWVTDLGKAWVALHLETGTF